MCTRSKIILLFLTFGYVTCSRSQNEFSKWYFGLQAGLDFSTQPPTVLTSSIINAPEGVASMCDNAGNLLFYGAGNGIVNSTHTTMANGNGLFGGLSSTQGVVYVRQPGSSYVYYVFTTEEVAGVNGFRYSIVDMSLAAGLGSVTVKNAPLYTPTCEKQVAVRHCNGRDVWIITHHYGTNEFRTYLLTAAGIAANPVVSAIGESPAGSFASTAGHLKISQDGKKLAMATTTNSIPTSMGVGGFFLFDFDAGTGVVSNSLTLISGQNLPTGGGAYGLEFSADGTKLYGSSTPYGNVIGALYQWDVCAPSNPAIVSSQYSVSLTGPKVGSLQRAIDGKIYLAAATSQSLHVINNPNAAGAAMNFAISNLNVAPGTSKFGLPNYINLYTRVPYSALSNTVACQTVSFSSPPAPTFSSGCSASPYPPNAYLWNFGDPMSGAANTSTLVNPTHTYSLMGTYSVSLILYSNCTNDTLRKVITVSTPGPTLSVAGNSLICKGAKTIYTVSGGSSYVWSNNTTASTATFSPVVTTVYSVTATLNGCSSTKVFTVTVNPCLGLPDGEENAAFRIFPNPVKDVLFIEAGGAANLLVYDLNGAFILEHKISSGHNEISTATLQPGVYTIQLSGEKHTWRTRLIKLE